MNFDEFDEIQTEREELRQQIIVQNEAGNAQMDRRVMLFGFAALAVLMAGVTICYLYDIVTGLLVVVLAFLINIISHIRQVSSNVVKSSRDMQLLILHQNDTRDEILKAVRQREDAI